MGSAIVPLRIRDEEPCANLCFLDGDGEEVGRLDWGSGQLIFTGDMTESARIFFEGYLEPLILAVQA